MKKQEYIVWDIETAGIGMDKDFICGVIYHPGGDTILCDQADQFIRILTHGMWSHVICGHNIVCFDLPYLCYWEQIYKGTHKLLNSLQKETTQIWDTLIMSRKAFPARQDHSLEMWGEQLQGDYKLSLKTEVQDFTDTSAKNIKLIKERCKNDVKINWAVMDYILNNFGIGGIPDYAADMKMFPMFAEILSTGLPYDTEEAKRVADKLEVTTYIPGNRLKRAAPAVNFNSNMQVDKWLKHKYGTGLPRTEKNRAKMNKDNKEELCQQFPILFDHFAVKQVVSTLKYISPAFLKTPTDSKTYMGNYLHHNERLDHKCVYPSFSYIGTRTGRGQYAAPAIQQMSKAARDVITAPTGWLWIGMDIIGLELAWFAWLCKELCGNTVVWEQIQRGESAKKLTLEAFDEVMGKVVLYGVQTREDVAKTITYSCLYGIGVGTLCRRLNLPDTKANKDKIKKCIEARFPAMEELNYSMRRNMGDAQYITDYFGRKVITEKWKCLNAFIQSSGAAYSLRMMHTFWQEWKADYGEDVIACLYQMDEIGLLCRTSRSIKDMTKIAREITQDTEEKFVKIWDCPLIARCNTQVGHTWKEGH